MTADTIRTLDMLKRINRFIVEQPMALAMPRATVAHAEVVDIIDALETAAAGQATGSGGSEGGVELRARTARELRIYLKNVTRTGRSIAIDHPDVPAVFRLPRTVSYPALIAQARAIIAAATPIQQSFIDAGLPTTFLTEVEALLAAFENATGMKQGGGSRGCSTPLRSRPRQRWECSPQPNSMPVCAILPQQPEMLAAWASRPPHRTRPRNRSSAPPSPRRPRSPRRTPVSTLTINHQLPSRQQTALARAPSDPLMPEVRVPRFVPSLPTSNSAP
jgi:hypothetical protein